MASGSAEIPVVRRPTTLVPSSAIVDPEKQDQGYEDDGGLMFEDSSYVTGFCFSFTKLDAAVLTHGVGRCPWCHPSRIIV